MSLIFTEDVIQDTVAISVARATAIANKRAHELGVDVLQSLITITQRSANGDASWRINYGPKDYLNRRGGDLIIEVKQSDGRIEQVLWGQ